MIHVPITRGLAASDTKYIEVPLDDVESYLTTTTTSSYGHQTTVTTGVKN